ncbi:MAG: hypothetical protein JST82_04740 [Bacteroidetes bacterium]|nr:hypothetical protein [Bacteroidota bacterium]
MRKILAFSITLLIAGTAGYCQSDLFDNAKLPPRNGWIFSVNGNYDMPAGNMAKRFGNNFRIGGEIFYKTKSNWIFGPKFDFITGGKIKEDSLLINVKDANNTIINIDGERIGYGTFERGYMAGVQAGKIFNIGKKSSDNGIAVLTSVGFMQHKINIFDRTSTIVQLKKENKKGYDRLTNGLYIEEYICYNYFANNGLINFHIGLDFTLGITKGRRDYLYDVMRTDDKQRFDILFGIRGGWYLPIFKRKSEEFFFE